MKIPVVRILFVLIAAAAALFSLGHGDHGYLTLIALAVFILAAFIKLGNDDNRIFILATGELLVITVAAASFWVGFVVQCAVIGAVLFDVRIPADFRDLPFFAFFCIAALTGAIIFDRSNSVLIPFLVVTTIVAAMTVILVSVQEIRERRLFSGAK
jgi:hypothetical protein